jgi:hypothetical protein
MLCVEVSVNGIRHCLAAPVDTCGFSAFVSHLPAGDGGTTSTLRVSAVSSDLTVDYQWGDEHVLTAGDVVTIRVVDAKAPDVPVASPSALSRLFPRRRFPDVSRFIARPLEKPDRGRAMLTWLVLLYVAALLQHCPR